MAILKMNKIRIYGLLDDRNAVLEELQKSGLVEICEPDAQEAQFAETANAIAGFDRDMQSAESALSVLDEFAPEKSGLFTSKRSLSMDDYQMAEDNEALVATFSRLTDLRSMIQVRTQHLREANAKLPDEEQDELVKQDPEVLGYIAEITELDGQRRQIELFIDHLGLLKDKYQALAKTALTEHAFMIEGFIPEIHGADLKAGLESKYTAFVELSEPDEEEDVPVAFKNNAFTAPVETITETYSMPSTTDLDPNPIMSFFYYLFFGIMFGDAGYGLLMAVVCGYLGFSDRLDKEKRRNYIMFFYCGLSTVFWGVMFGGFFGDIIYTISFTFFGSAFALTPLWMDPIAQAMDLLMYSIAIGIVHILIGLSIKVYTLSRQGKIVDAVCDVGFWMLIFVGVSGMALGMGMESPGLSSGGQWITIAGAAGIALTGGRKSKGIVGKLFGGVAALYNITGYISDALSYCRLMALCLASGAIANVINLLGTMSGNTVIGFILFIVIGLFGHGVNFAMGALGAYVHTNRLQYVEYFSKFYEGGGRKFVPFRMNTRFYRFSDE